MYKSILILLLLSGCATLQDVAVSPNTTAVCSAADVATTAFALHHGAVESNPVIKLLLKPFGIFGYAAFSGFIVYEIYEHYKEIPPAEMGAVNGIRCGAAISNLRFIH